MMPEMLARRSLWRLVRLCCARLLAVGWLGLGQASIALAVDDSCKLQYPIVLSHHWGARAICPDATATGAHSCVQIEDYERLCADKGKGPDGQRTCGAWRVPAEDADLPPHDVNAHDPTLTRDLRGVHRYFSRAIVDRLVKTCGNKVYIPDKPIYGSYDARARVMRTTVRQALAETGAPKVIVIGLSQGAQDARFMTAALPVDDKDPAQGRMSDKVAAVVTLAGEDQGAESAWVQLSVLFMSNHGDWTDATRTGNLWSDDIARKLFWRRTGADGRTRYVLSEHCQGADCDLKTPTQRYAWGLRSLAELSPRYMRPGLLSRWFTFDWDDLRATVGMAHDHWEEQVPRAIEANNGVKYYSYAMGIQSLADGLDRPGLYWGLRLLAGRNDGYVTIGSQTLDNPASNFEHIKTLMGASSGHGYHHMFATGRNDRLYQPAPAEREAAPYDGDAAAFYQQVARDLKRRGH